MFEKPLEEKFKRIFDVKKVSYDQPSDSEEQDTIFINIETSKNTIKDTAQISRVIGQGIIFGQANKLKFGFLSKKIAASIEDTKLLYFYDIEENDKLFNNVVQRSFSFVYFFNSQYDPDKGTIEQIDFEEL